MILITNSLSFWLNILLYKSDQFNFITVSAHSTLSPPANFNALRFALKLVIYSWTGELSYCRVKTNFKYFYLNCTHMFFFALISASNGSRIFSNHTPSNAVAFSSKSGYSLSSNCTPSEHCPQIRVYNLVTVALIALLSRT